MTRISEGELSYISSSSDPDSRIEQTTIHKESIPHELNSLHIPSQVLQPKPTPGSPFHPVNGPEPTQKTNSGLTKLRHDPSTGLPKPVFIAPNPRSEKKKGKSFHQFFYLFWKKVLLFFKVLKLTKRAVVLRQRSCPNLPLFPLRRI
jgi:hypothetical protein